MIFLRKMCFIVLTIIIPVQAHSADFQFSNIDKQKLADVLFNEIERLDASAVSIRNSKKTVSWKDYRRATTKNIVESNNFKELAAALDRAQQGFINSHSAIQLYSNFYNSRELYTSPPDHRGLELGYEFPNIKFFTLGSKRYVNSINGINLLNSFNEFENYRCEYAHQISCIDKFVKWIKFGLVGLNIKQTNTFGAPNGENWDETIQTREANPNAAWPADCKEYADAFPSMSLAHSSKNACILQKGQQVLFKLKRFAQWGVPQNDLYCNATAKADTLCHEVQSLTNLLSKLDSANLIVDVQGNSGGSENTPLVSLVTQNGFYDNLVRYKNTKEMLDEDFRTHAFYGVSAAEKWYTKSSGAKSAKKYLNPRADFCRGDESCAFEKIASKTLETKIDKLIVVTDENCFSSCDDFVWRAKQYGNGLVIGQTPVTDSTYVSVTGILYHLPSGEMKVKVIAPGQQYALEDDATKLVWFSVPYTLTVDKIDRPIDGDERILDKFIPITMANYGTIGKENILNAIRLAEAN
ncbi:MULTISPECIES: S41 family peptidase [Pseudoalteromonas]|uniref:S41 family peptidase n=1 Tax=Pseudoalteromonas TaxID=53246 RepID=UPI001582334D|nr:MULTISPECIES: S41 family peptidase [Pseudoalteromonas]MDI4654647.1 S41 family peptidase [Pseudoalteromonas shioyasakiensis]NUJ41037.1 hypothetical protein [Pseudoalteromonas sp. 0303]